MILHLKSKIWLTVAAIVLMFSFFTLYYFPDQQAKLLLNNYNNEVQNLANTVSLGVKIAITEQNFEGVQTALEFVKDDSRLEFISMVQTDTIWNEARTSYQVQEKLFKSFPEDSRFDATAVSNDSILVKRSPFQTSMMSGAILIGFSTKAINEGKAKIMNTSLLVSTLVFSIGILIGFWLSKTISKPVLALRDAANKVSEGDFTTRVHNVSGDEIGELGKSFNEMVEYLSVTTHKLKEANHSLATTNGTLNTTLLELKETQAQLIQKEKMASLGELTAGIAHEIQNPLNFVNNFSEINQELIDEMVQELQDGNTEDAVAIAQDIKANEQKISAHGKRADAIVKGMLQHSRTSTGKKEPTDLNRLADEFLRLSYHGLRAKNKSFNAGFKTHLDQNIGKVDIAPEEIGRVLLNLYNNAFYSINQKKQQLNGTFEPEVVVTTSLGKDMVEISVKDNGLGIPQNILDKIYQPFFTTKPTGEGTGLGLSLSYDIITKGHGGGMRVETEEGKGAEFIIQLPVSS
ncbi:HAMP domain-containing sensor histidine kinase [Rufibacter hautae]|uniref:histidine kinase n=1 Tax=Rufibacter hautae TaxID=2595005 RepID=A0A5B6TLS0_9BACT|nr:HAMP domain-containing sensor histidine kinase [Rufibacter hautae]KAA3440335.1 HAMP domain-containing protein [Rufibacter hautae]